MTLVEKMTLTLHQETTYHLVAPAEPGDLASGCWPPASLVESYVWTAHRHRRVEQLEDGSWYAEVLALPGVWADGATQEEAEDELLDVIQGWVDLKLERGDSDIPVIDGMDLRGI